MSRRHYTSQGTSHIVHPGYRYQSNPHAKFVRPAGEPPLWLGVLLLAAMLGVIVAGVLLISALSEPTAASLAVNAPAVAISPTSSVVEAGAANREAGR